ncbi:MAG: hypothetical protein P8130_14240 [Deltaproteobacteria bacterium]
MAKEKGFYWQRHPEVEAFFHRYLDRSEEKSPTLARFAVKLGKLTDTFLLDWVDHLVLPATNRLRGELQELGFERQPEVGVEVFRHPGVLLPAVLLADKAAKADHGLALRAESVADFLQVNGFRATIEGKPLSPYRRAVVAVENECAFMVVERRGSRDYVSTSPADAFLPDYLAAIETWQSIPRGIEDEDKAFTAISATAAALVRKLGQDLAAHIVCLCERKYWLSRNFAARMQKSRQDTLGLGWANHDHHTYRSSRRHFAKLIGLFSQLGFHRRERYYAGREAGWGAQLMENEAAGLVLFLDVDLQPDEVDIDFSKTELKPTAQLGTVGLWCALHGDSILKAGMHHLAARFDFNLLREDIAQFGVKFMAPFSDFPYLKQAFSVAENWPVEPRRLQALVDRQAITAAQAERFGGHGAVGSHLENIQRREGYKGFNKKKNHYHGSRGPGFS